MCLKVQASPLADKTHTTDSFCVLNKYVIPCKSYEDKEYFYFELATVTGKVMVIKRASKKHPDQFENWWVAPELREAQKAYDTAHSF